MTRVRSGGKQGPGAVPENVGTTGGTSPTGACPNSFDVSLVVDSWQRIANPPSPVRIREGPFHSHSIPAGRNNPQPRSLQGTCDNLLSPAFPSAHYHAFPFVGV